jgi:hypothetical protein
MDSIDLYGEMEKIVMFQTFNSLQRLLGPPPRISVVVVTQGVFLSERGRF